MLISKKLKIGRYGIGFTWRNSKNYRYLRLKVWLGYNRKFKGIKLNAPYFIDLFKKP